MALHEHAAFDGSESKLIEEPCYHVHTVPVNLRM